MSAFQKFDVQEYLRGEYKPPQPKTLVSLGTLGHIQSNSAFTEAELEQFEERAGIMQFDAHLPRQFAEKYAMKNVIEFRRYKNGR